MKPKQIMYEMIGLLHLIKREHLNLLKVYSFAPQSNVPTHEPSKFAVIHI